MPGGLDVGLTGGKNFERRAQVHRRNGDVGLVVFTTDLKEKETRFTFALNPIIGFEMALNGAFGGVPDIIHDGTDSVAYTGSNIIGTKVTFDSTDTFTDWPPAGTKSVKVDKPLAGHIWEFDKGSDLDLSDFTAISMKVLVDSGWSAGNSVSVYGYDTGTGLQVGNAVLLETFFNEQDFGTIQTIAIPLELLALGDSTIDSIRAEVISKSGVGIVCYFDTIQFEESSGTKTFAVLAPQGTKYFIKEFKFTYIGPIASTLADGTMPSISYDKILGVGKLGTGIGFALIKNQSVVFDASITCLADSTRGGSTLENIFSDGINTHVTVNTLFSEPILLDSRRGDAITITINDDLTGLISFTAIALGHTIKITNHLKD